MRYYYIIKGWMLSRGAHRLYRLAATLSLALLVMLIAGRSAKEIPANFVPLARFLLLAGVLGTATTMVAMEYFLFGFDNSSAWKKALWFCVMLLPPLGPALYCFIVYSRSSVTDGASPHCQRNDP